jgi:TonB family protein
MKALCLLLVLVPYTVLAQVPPGLTAPSPVTQVKPSPQPVESADKQRHKKLLDAMKREACKFEPATSSGEDPYYSHIAKRLRLNYFVPSVLLGRNFEVRVKLRLNPSGEVLEAALATSSGNDVFDQSVLNVVKETAPFCPPPPHLREKLQQQGAILEFVP